MMKQSPYPICKQKGLAAVVTAVVLLIAVTIVIIFSAKFGVVELRISANEARHKEAQQLADAALEQGASFIRRNPTLYEGSGAGWADCTPVQATFPCTVSIENLGSVQYDQVYGTVTMGPPASITPFPLVAIDTLTDSSTAVPTISVSDGSRSETYILFDDDGAGETLTVVGVGTSKDGIARAAARINYAKVTLVTPGEIPPVMAPELNLNGNFTIVANPNNGPGTSGIPISGWTASEDAGTGTWQTCHLGDYQDSGTVCTDEYDAGDDWSGCICTTSISNKDNINYDIYEDNNFPDPLEYLFGTNDVGAIKTLIIDAGGKYYDVGEGCTGLETLDLNSLKVPMVFVEDDCNVPNVGTKDTPIVLVVNGKMTINANTDAWGLLVSVTEVQSNGAAVIHGSLVAEGVADLANGGYTQVYTPEVFTNLSLDELNTELSKIPYSWTDLITNLPN